MSNIYSNAAYKEGMTSYSNAEGIYENPYSSGSPEYNAFERGWTQALKRDPCPVGRKIQFIYKQYTKTKPIEDPKLKKAKDAYLKSRGY